MFIFIVRCSSHPDQATTSSDDSKKYYILYLIIEKMFWTEI